MKLKDSMLQLPELPLNKIVTNLKTCSVIFCLNILILGSTRCHCVSSFPPKFFVHFLLFTFMQFSLPSHLLFHYPNIRRSAYVAIIWLWVPVLLLLRRLCLEHQWIRDIPFLVSHSHQTSRYVQCVNWAVDTTCWIPVEKTHGLRVCITGIPWFASCHRVPLK